MTAPESTPFRIEDKVRDYELDMQGVVNNSTYFQYCEHARHEFLLSKGVDFAALARENINLVVTEAHGKFKAPLTSGDRYRIDVRLERQGQLRFVFLQKIHRLSDEKLVFEGRITGTALNERGRPFFPESLEALLD